MTNLPIFPEHEAQGDDTPFPLFIAKRFNFPLAYHERGDEIYYCIQDWLRGLTSERNVSGLFANMKSKAVYSRVTARTQKMPYLSSDKKTYKLEFTTTENLLQIMFHLRILASRPILAEARILFSDRLAQQDEVRLFNHSKSKKTFFDSDIDQLDLDIEDWQNEDFLHYRITNEEKRVYDNYFKSKLHTPHLLEYFTGRTKDGIKPHYYDIITTDIYKGIWRRSPEQLKIQMGAPTVSSMKIYMPLIAHSFHHIVYEAVKTKLSNKEVWWYEIRYCVQEAASICGYYAKEISEYIGEDLATGRPLLVQG